MDKIIKRNFAVWVDERQLMEHQDYNNKTSKTAINPFGFDSDLWYELFNRFKSCMPDASTPTWHMQEHGRSVPDTPNSSMPPLWSLYRPSATDCRYRLCLDLPTFVISQTMIIYSLSGNSNGSWSNLMQAALPKHQDEWGWRYSVLVPSEKINISFHGTPGKCNGDKISSMMIHRAYGLVVADTSSPTDLSVEGLHAAADVIKGIAIHQARAIKKKCEEAYPASLVARELSR